MIYLAGDHHAEEALVRIRSYLRAARQDFKEFGYQSGAEPKAKLQEFIPQLAKAVRTDEGSSGILVCGTGVGVEIGANRFPGIRASLCSTPRSAEWARTYDDANVLCIASWALTDLKLDDILRSWLQTGYDGDKQRREMFRVFDSWSGPEEQ